MDLKRLRVITPLATCQAALLTNNIIVIGLNGLVGYAMLGNDKSLATLPIATYIAGTAAMTFPASIWMKRFGRRHGFLVGTIIGLFGALVCVAALFMSSFAVLCFGTLMIGAYNAFGQYYRFAAAEMSSPERAGRAISLVLAGGIVGAIAGPEAAKLTKDLFAVQFAGTYAFLACLAFVAFAIQAGLDLPTVKEEPEQSESRPLSQIARQPGFIMAVLSSTLGYAGMNMLMTSAPIEMISHHHGYADAAFVIQWHALAMFAPSFATGALIKRAGVIAIIRLGALLMFACAVAAALLGTGVNAFWVSLVLLGVGWNFLYVGGSTLLIRNYRVSERAKAQALHDQTVFLSTAISTILSGWLLQRVGWQILLGVTAAMAAIVLLASIWLAESNRKVPQFAKSR
ncbi:MFS transporter [Bradyrhizobium sp. McL0616]|uniref:MFS transporter n=1 Tax=Bradyrhizobium sp. McL0616 TaxID=3415674 RepID=UPI003CF869A2